jgi:hypothetical protein
VVDKNRVSRLIAELDSDDFQTRENATRELDSLEENGLGFYRKALEAKPSTALRRRLLALVEKHSNPWRNPSPERVRSLRVLEVLELAGIWEARQVLKALANPNDPALNALITWVDAVQARNARYPPPPPGPLLARARRGGFEPGFDSLARNTAVIRQDLS